MCGEIEQESARDGVESSDSTEIVATYMSRSCLSLFRVVPAAIVVVVGADSLARGVTSA